MDKIVFIEALRVFLSLYVFLYHSHVFDAFWVGYLFRMAQEAVMVFFVLSGYIIFHSTQKIPCDRYGVLLYVTHRIRRIYPVFIVALVLSYLALCVQGRSWVDMDVSSFFANMFMLQDVSFLKKGVVFSTYLKNTALWSLSYEWWFYMAFIPIGILARDHLKHAKGFVCAVSFLGYATHQVFPNQVSLFASYWIVWWSGAELSFFLINRNTTPWAFHKTQAVLLGVCSVLWGMPVFFAWRAGDFLGLGVQPVLHFRHFISVWIVFMVCVWFQTLSFKPSSKGLHLFARWSKISYSFYLFQIPVTSMMKSMLYGFSVYVQTFCSFLALLPLCWFFEVFVQKHIHTCTDRWLGWMRNRAYAPLSLESSSASSGASGEGERMAQKTCIM